jgi:sugar/nucleoside kinase (ribokinase family)
LRRRHAARPRPAGGAGNQDPSKFLLADSRDRIGLFRNLCLKPNLDEAFTAFEKVCSGPIERYNDGAVAHGLAEGCGRAVFCTLGSDGILLANPPHEPRYVRTFPPNGPADVVGAGDSCSAGIACAMVSGATHEQAAAFGNLVASITIQQLGTTGTATPDQVRSRWREVSGNRARG